MQAFWKKGVWKPEIAMCTISDMFTYQRGAIVLLIHCLITRQALVLGGYLSSTVGKSPWWISQDGRKSCSINECTEIPD